MLFCLLGHLRDDLCSYNFAHIPHMHSAANSLGPTSVLPPSIAQKIGGMCMTAVAASPGRQSSSLWHHAVLIVGLLAVCIVAVTQLPPLHETAGVLSEAVGC